MNRAMQAKENDDRRRYIMPLFLGDNLLRNLIVTAVLFSKSSAIKIKQESTVVYKTRLVQFID